MTMNPLAESQTLEREEVNGADTERRILGEKTENGIEGKEVRRVKGEG